MSCSLDCNCQFTLVECAGTGYPSGQDLCSVGHALSQTCDILVIDGFNTIYAEHANLFPWSFIISRCSFHDGCSSNLHNCIFLMWYLFRKELRRRLKSLQNRLNHPTEWMHPEQASQRQEPEREQMEPEQAADKRPDIRRFADTDFEWDNRLADCWQLHFSILRTKHCLPVHPWNNVLPHSDRCSRCFAGCLLQ